VGAVAGMVISKKVREYAQEKGLYVLVQSGDTTAAVEPPERFKPREWQRAVSRLAKILPMPLATPPL
jgi:hypothetical protein